MLIPRGVLLCLFSLLKSEFRLLKKREKKERKRGERVRRSKAGPKPQRQWRGSPGAETCTANCPEVQRGHWLKGNSLVSPLCPTPTPRPAQGEWNPPPQNPRESGGGRTVVRGTLGKAISVVASIRRFGPRWEGRPWG